MGSKPDPARADDRAAEAHGGKLMQWSTRSTGSTAAPPSWTCTGPRGGGARGRWLQRDFGLYVVNMFDTGQAARVLQYPGLGLKSLLQHFCDVRVRRL